MLNMASEQRTESVSDKAATGFARYSDRVSCVPAEALFVRTRRIKVVTREYISSLFDRDGIFLIA